VEEHFRAMKALGVNTARIFLTAASFFPEPPALAEEGLRKLDRMLEIARRHGIRLHPTGPDHWEGNPPWRRGDIYSDPQALEAQAAFWRELARRYRGEPAFFAFDLLNEPHVPWDSPALRSGYPAWLLSRYGSLEKIRAAWGGGPPSLDELAPPPDQDAPGSSSLLDYQRYRESVAEEWVRSQAEAVHREDPERLVTAGLIQWSVPVLHGKPSRYSAFRPERIARLVDFSSIHFYPLNGDPIASPEAFDQNLAYLELVLRCSALAGKPLVLGEFGWYGGGSPDGHPARSLEDQLRWNRALLDQSRGLAAGWLNWAWADTPASRDITKFSGLVTSSGQVKPWGEAFRALSGSLSGARMDEEKSALEPFLFDFDRTVCDSGWARRELERYVAAWKTARRLPLQVR
jgi:hypothetical protein